MIPQSSVCIRHRLLIGSAIVAALGLNIVLGGCSVMHHHAQPTLSTQAFIPPDAPASEPGSKGSLAGGPTGSGAAQAASAAAPGTTTMAGVSKHVAANRGSGWHMPAILPPPDIQAAPPPPAGQPLTVAALLGTVNGHPIFAGDVLSLVAKQLQQEARQSRTKDYFDQLAVDTVAQAVRARIDHMLILQAAKRNLTKDDYKQVDTYVRQQEAKFLTQYQGSEATADRELRLQGSSMAKKMTSMRHMVTIQLYLERTITSRLVVTRRQIWDYYQSHLAEFTQQPAVDLYTITYPVLRQWPKDPGDPSHTRVVAHPTPAQLAEARSKALAYCDQLENKLKHGANFAFMAEDVSTDAEANNGGHWGIIKAGTLANAKVQSVAFSLPSHGMAPPLLVEDPKNPANDQVEIIKVGRVWHKHVTPFSQAQQKISKELKQRMWTRMMEKFRQQLYGDAAVEAIDQMVATATQVATSEYFRK
ncbi:MAG: peptidylprolyl isomerase [Phycisphaerae bacterium]